MKNTQEIFFSNERFQLFIHENGKIQQNETFYSPKYEKNLDVQTPTQSKQALLLIIQKKDSQIHRLRKKLKVYETDLFQTKQKLDSKIYELEYFKKKISEEFQKSKELQGQIDFINAKIIEMITKLNCVKKLKNPIEIKNNYENQIKISQKVQNYVQNQNISHHIDFCCLDYLEKEVVKVVSVIESAISIKRIKKLKQSNNP